MWSDILYTNPLLHLLKKYFTPIKGAGGGGAWALVPLALAIPVTVLQPGFVNGVPKRGSEANERGEGVGGGNDREIKKKKKSCMKTKFSCTLNTIIRGSLCSGIDQFPTLFYFHSFPNEFVAGEHFPFFLYYYYYYSFYFLFFYYFNYYYYNFFFLLADQQGGGGACPPCAPLSQCTHTHCSDLQPVDFNREFAISGILHATVDMYTSEFSRITMDLLCMWNLTI